MVTWAAALPSIGTPPASSRRAGRSRPTQYVLWSKRLQAFADVYLLGQRAGLHRKVDEFLEVRLVLGAEILGREIAHHPHGGDHVVGRERVLDQVLSRVIGTLVAHATRTHPA